MISSPYLKKFIKLDRNYVNILQYLLCFDETNTQLLDK